jgi:hypothetical protein
MIQLPAVSSSVPTTVQLTIVQLTNIFDQLGYHGAVFIPQAQVFLQLEPFQLQSLNCSAVAIPYNMHHQGLTVQSIISSTPNIRHSQSRINRQFVQNLANQLGITEREFAEVIQNPSSGNVDELTHYLNEIFGDLVNPPLTHNEVREILAMTLPFSN